MRTDMANLSRRVVLIAMLGLLFIGSSPVVRAGVTLTVNTTVDAVDALPGDGVCETAPGSQTCTLRAAVQETNAQPGPDTISVPPGIYTSTIASDGDEDPRFGDLDVFDDLVVNGSGAAATIIDGNQLDRVFDVPGAGYTLTLNRITVRNGRAAGYSYNDGGGVRNVGSLIVNDSIFSGNSADEGGGHFNFSGVVVTNSIFSQNTAYTGGAIYNNGGGATILNSTISDNTAVDGGGITNGGIMRINRST